jgi:hypothetical protein
MITVLLKDNATIKAAYQLCGSAATTWNDFRSQRMDKGMLYVFSERILTR